MEVILSTEDNSFPGLHALPHVRPLSRKFDARFDRFGTRIHRENHIITEHRRDGLREPSEDGIVERS